MTIFYPFFFIFGLIVGSFLNAVIYRLEEKESFLKGRSYCPRCKHVLNWKDLIPVLSFLILRGRCRYCGKKISFQYPLVELATGFLFFLTAYNTLQNANCQNLITAGYYLVVLCFLVIVFVLKEKG